MRNIKKFIILCISIIFIIAISFIIFKNYETLNKKIIEPPLVEKEINKNDNKNELSDNLVDQREVKEKESYISTLEDNLHFKLQVLDQFYDVSFKEGDTLEMAMVKFDIERDDFSFITSNHPSLGSFVEEINNMRGSIGKYFIYYINGKSADVGISKYVLKEGDIINWKLE